MNSTVTKLNPVLTHANVTQSLEDHGAQGLHLDVFDTLPSTSAYLSELAQSDANRVAAAASPHICVADWQTNGSGRRGKTWTTDRGNITFSMLVALRLKPAELMGLSLVTGLAVAEVLNRLDGVSVQLKWPNDILVDDAKLCGVLTELVPANHSGFTSVVTGIGINYVTPNNTVSNDYRATALQEICENAPARAELIGQVSVSVLQAYDLFESQGWAVFAERWNALDYLKGKQVNVLNGTQQSLVVAKGVDHTGALLVESDGETSTVYSGEVSVRVA